MYVRQQALLFTPIVFFMVQYDFTVEKFAIFFLLYLQSVALYTFFGQMLVYIVPIPALATVLGGGRYCLPQISSSVVNSHSLLGARWSSYQVFRASASFSCVVRKLNLVSMVKGN